MDRQATCRYVPEIEVFNTKFRVLYLYFPVHLGDLIRVVLVGWGFRFLKIETRHETP